MPMILKKVIRYFSAVLLIIISLLATLPPIPSRPMPPTRLGLFDLSILISTVFFAIGILLLRGKSHPSTTYTKKGTKICIIFIGLFLCHLTLRYCFWLSEESAFFGKPLYNILVHSIVYSVIMFFIFILMQNNGDNIQCDHETIDTANTNTSNRKTQ